MAGFDITKTTSLKDDYTLMPPDPIKVHGEMKVDMGLLMELFAETNGTEIDLKQLIQFLNVWEIPMSRAVRKLGYAAGVLWTYEDTSDEETWKRMDEKYREMEREWRRKNLSRKSDMIAEKCGAENPYDWNF